jgi:hypothetical protein
MENEGMSFPMTQYILSVDGPCPATALNDELCSLHAAFLEQPLWYPPGELLC